MQLSKSRMKVASLRRYLKSFIKDADFAIRVDRFHDLVNVNVR